MSDSITDHWREVTLDDVADEVTVGYVGSMTKEYIETGIPWLRNKNVDPFNIDWDDMKYVSEEFHTKLRKSSLSPGDVVIVRTGKPGAAALIPEDLPVANCSDLVIVRCGEELDKRFCVYYLNSAAKHHIHSHLVGAVQQHFNVGAAKKLKMHLPPLPEQRAIASILGALDDKIELNRRMNATLESLARAIFKSWFVDFDPVRANAVGMNAGLALTGQMPASSAIPTTHDPKVLELFPSTFQDSELGPIPEGWTAMPISEAVEINPRRTLPRGTIAKYLDMKNVPTRGHRPDQIVDREMKSGTKFINGDTLMARITPCLENGKTAFVDFLPEGEVGWGSTEFIVMRPRPPLPNAFGYFLARDPDVRQHAIKNMSGTSGRQRVAKECFDGYLIAVPGEPVANAFAKVINPIMAEVRAVSNESVGLARLRDALLPQLLSGGLPVPVTSGGENG